MIKINMGENTNLSYNHFHKYLWKYIKKHMQDSSVSPSFVGYPICNSRTIGSAKIVVAPSPCVTLEGQTAT